MRTLVMGLFWIGVALIMWLGGLLSQAVYHCAYEPSLWTLASVGFFNTLGMLFLWVKWLGTKLSPDENVGDDDLLPIIWT